MKNRLILSIQNELNKLTKKRYSRSYIDKKIYPIFQYIILSKQKNFLIAGSQGIGKSTLLKILTKNLNIFYNIKVLALSLDDYYLTKKERMVLSKKTHSLLLTRGVPGTHDIKLLMQNIVSFKRSQYPIKIPVFKKLSDDRSKKFKLINTKQDILILEGWCCGCPKITNSYLFKNINSLEKKEDKDKIWRKFYNHKLQHEYRKIFNCFSEIIYIKPRNFSTILNWRLKQEKMMKVRSNIKKSMSKKQIHNFIQYYEKITKWMILKMPQIANLTIYVDNKKKINKLKIK